jgi:sigma-B regulation protein RsbU (phosphoserine phosphatase)
MSASPPPVVPQIGPGRRDTEVVIASFRTILILVVLFSPQFMGSLGTSGRWLVAAGVAAACYNLALLLAHVGGMDFPRWLIVACDLTLISSWIFFCSSSATGPGQGGEHASVFPSTECRVFFGLYYAVVVVSALWFGIAGACASALAACLFYTGALLAAADGRWHQALAGSTVLQMVFLVAVAGVVSVMAELQKRERQALEQSQATLHLFRQRIQIAQRIDELVRPRRLAAVPGIDIAFRYRPAAAPHDAGGDYYDVIRLTGRGAGICIGDIRANLEMATPYLPVFKSEFRATARRDASPGRVLTEMNRWVAEEIRERQDSDAFISMCYLVMDLDAGTLTYAIAGNEPPVLIPGAGGPARSLEKAGIVLGVLPDATYEQEVLPLHTGDLLVLFTDGMTEAMDASGRSLEREGLLSLVLSQASSPTADAIAERVFEQVTEYGRLGRYRDDMTMLVARVTAPDVGAGRQADARGPAVSID